MASEPAAGISAASSPMLEAQNRQAMSANTTESGSAPPASTAPAGIEAAIAAPGAMSVMLWNSTSRSPMAFRRSPRAAGLEVLVSAASVIAIPPFAASRWVPLRR